MAEEKWRGEPITLSGVTDCYQPAERKLRLTRGCLEVMLEARQPLGIITKNTLVTRDLDLLAPLAAQNLARVFVSITTLDDQLARTLEPRTATPQARLRAVSELARSGVSVGVMVAPIIPGLNDQEMPAILAAAKEAGAQWAGYVLLRLPYAVRPIFEDWIRRSYPEKAERVVALIRETRDGRMNNSKFGTPHARARSIRRTDRKHVQGVSTEARARSAAAPLGFVAVHSAATPRRANASVLANASAARIRLCSPADASHRITPACDQVPNA